MKLLTHSQLTGCKKVNPAPFLCLLFLILGISKCRFTDRNFQFLRFFFLDVDVFALYMQEKLCHEVAGDVKEAAMAETIKTELYQVERQMYVLEKEENELRRVRCTCYSVFHGFTLTKG